MRCAIGFILMLFFLIGCGEAETVRPTPDVNYIKAEAKVLRYDEALRDFDTTDIRKSYTKLLSKYPRLTDLYFKQLIRLHDPKDDIFFGNIKDYLGEDRVTLLADTIAEIYPDIEALEKNLTQACKYAIHYFPGYKIPNFYTLFSLFGYQSFIFQDVDNKDAIGIGLDLFLGEDFEYKSIDPANPIFSEYLTRSYNKDHIVKKSMEMILEDMAGSPNGKRFVDVMIHQGKKQYVLEHLLPTTHDTILWEYTPAQLAWVENSELAMWDYFLKEELLYETSHLKTLKYLQPAPTSKGMPPQSPGRTGVYSGYKIVKAFMKQYPETTFRELFELNDSQSFLELSKYKPPRR